MLQERNIMMGMWNNSLLDIKELSLSQLKLNIIKE